MNRIRQLRDQYNIKQIDLCKQLNVSQGTLSVWENGIYEPNITALKLMSEIFNCSIDYILGQEIKNAPDISEAFDTKPYNFGVPVRFVGSIKCGPGGLAFQEDKGFRYADVANPDDYIFLLVKGDSMEPDIREGSLALIRLQPEVPNGKVAAVIINGNEGMLKRINTQNGVVVLESFNPNHPAIILSGEALTDFRIVGQLVQSTKEW